MTAYAIARLTDVNIGRGVVEYLERIDATLAPFDGHFIVHGARPDQLEGDWTGDLVIIQFPDRALATAWYRSEAYQAILPLRTRNSRGETIIIEGVDSDHRATDVLAGLPLAEA